MPSVVTFAQLPGEEPAFLAYLKKSGNVWARAVNDDPYNPDHEPLPVSDFLERFSDKIVAYHVVNVYLGFRDDIFRPAIHSREVIKGGTLVPFVQDGKVIECAHKRIGGTKVLQTSIDAMGSSFVRYTRGQFRTEDQLAISNLCYYAGTYKGQIWVPNPPPFMKWAKNVLAWMRRHTPEAVPVYRCNYNTRATIAVAEACKKGLKVF